MIYFPIETNITCKLIRENYNTAYMEQLKLFTTEAYQEKTQLPATLPVRSCFLYQAAKNRLKNSRDRAGFLGEFANLVVSIFIVKGRQAANSYAAIWPSLSKHAHERGQQN